MSDDAPLVRPSSLRKRAAVLSAGRDLFLGEGYERTSVDAVAARAGISKRTVYDYFGDKDGLYDAVITEVAAEIVDTMRSAVDEELTTGRELRAALLALVRRVVATTFGSPDHVRLRQLAPTDRRARRNFAQFANQPEDLLAARFDQFVDEGELHTTNTGRAAQHFFALTFSLAANAISNAEGQHPDIDALLVDGVDAFLRAYR